MSIQTDIEDHLKQWAHLSPWCYIANPSRIVVRDRQRSEGYEAVLLKRPITRYYATEQSVESSQEEYVMFEGRIVRAIHKEVVFLQTTALHRINKGKRKAMYHVVTPSGYPKPKGESNNAALAWLQFWVQRLPELEAHIERLKPEMNETYLNYLNNYNLTGDHENDSIYDSYGSR